MRQTRTEQNNYEQSIEVRWTNSKQIIFFYVNVRLPEICFFSVRLFNKFSNLSLAVDEDTTQRICDSQSINQIPSVLT